MSVYGIEDCTAMSECGDWFAFDKRIPRGRVMAIMAESCMDWQAALHCYRIRSGFVRQVPPPDGSGGPWHAQCERDDEGAFPVWIVKGQGAS